MVNTHLYYLLMAYYTYATIKLVYYTYVILLMGILYIATLSLSHTVHRYTTHYTYASDYYITCQTTAPHN